MREAVSLYGGVIQQRLIEGRHLDKDLEVTRKDARQRGKAWKKEALESWRNSHRLKGWSK